MTLDERIQELEELAREQETIGQRCGERGDHDLAAIARDLAARARTRCRVLERERRLLAATGR